MRRWVRLGIGIGFSAAMLALILALLSFAQYHPATPAEAGIQRDAARSAQTGRAHAWSPTVPYEVRAKTTQNARPGSPAGVSSLPLPYTITGRVLDARGKPVVGLRLEIWADDGSRRLTFSRITTGQSGAFHAVASAPAIRLRLANGATIRGGIGSWPEPRGASVTVGPGSQTASVVIRLLPPNPAAAPPSTALMPPTSLAPPLGLPPSPRTTLAPPLTLPPSSTTTARPSTTTQPTTTSTAATTTTTPQATTKVPQTSTTVATTTTSAPQTSSTVAPG